VLECINDFNLDFGEMKRQAMPPKEEYRQSFKRLFEGQNLETTYCLFDGHTARNTFLRRGWYFAIDQGWLDVVEIDSDEQWLWYKGFLTEKGKKEVLSEDKTGVEFIREKTIGKENPK